MGVHVDPWTLLGFETWLNLLVPDPPLGRAPPPAATNQDTTETHREDSVFIPERLITSQLAPSANPFSEEETEAERGPGPRGSRLAKSGPTPRTRALHRVVKSCPGIRSCFCPAVCLGAAARGRGPLRGTAVE